MGFFDRRIFLSYLSSVGEAWDDGGDSLCRSDLAGVDHDEQLHEVVVHLSAAGLQDVHVLPSHRLPDFHAGKFKKSKLWLKRFSYKNNMYGYGVAKN